MSFMFNPHPYDDPTAVNRPNLPGEVINSIVSGTKEVAGYLTKVIIEKLEKGNVIVALDGYSSAIFDQIVNLLSQNLKLKSIEIKSFDVRNILKTPLELDLLFKENLPEDREKDPVSLFGKLFKGSYEDLFDAKKANQFEATLGEFKSGDAGRQVLIVYGNGCTTRKLRSYYDLVCYFDVTPKEVILRARKGLYVNLGDVDARPVKELLRRCYYVDFELCADLRRDLIENEAIDFYIASNNPDKLFLIPWKSFDAITSSLVKYPMRCKPVYIEGVWGGHYLKKIRNLPIDMVNVAWVFDLIPLEVSIVVEAGGQLIEFPFFTFVQKEGVALMGIDCVNKFGGYFPIRFNYDDTYHSSGNMSIQVHSGDRYNIENYGELGRQDESYYIVATGHGAKTYVGFNEEINTNEFISEVKRSEKEFTPIDYEKYVSHIDSVPGTQVLLPAGTIHSSGRNQVVLEIGSLTVGSYTYKMYDYLRADLDGVPRPIHIYHGERVLKGERTESWVKENLVQQPRLIRKGSNWAEYIIGEHNLLYFSLRRLEFEKEIEGDTNGKFHVLTLVDGEKVEIRSLDNPELSYTQNYLDVVIVPANMGRYIVRNLSNQPVCLHKTMLKDDFINDCVLNN